MLYHHHRRKCPMLEAWLHEGSWCSRGGREVQQKPKLHDGSIVMGMESGGGQWRDAAGAGRMMFLRLSSSSESPTIGAESWAGSLVESKRHMLLYHHHRNSPMVTTGAGHVLEELGQPKCHGVGGVQKRETAADVLRWEYSRGHPRREQRKGGRTAASKALQRKYSRGHPRRVKRQRVL